MSRNEENPQAPTLVAEVDQVSMRVAGGKGGEGTADHDPTLKWIISDLVSEGERTPPPLKIGTNEQPSKPDPSSAKEPSPLPRESQVPAHLPPPLAREPAGHTTPPSATTASPRTPPPKPAAQRLPTATSKSGVAPIAEMFDGATPADFFAADPTPPAPPPTESSPEAGVGAAPVAILPGPQGSDTELSADAVELLPAAGDDSGPELLPSATEDSGIQPRPTPAGNSGLEAASTLPTEPTYADTPREGISPVAPTPLPATEVPTEPREVEPEAVVLLESAEHQTAAADAPDTRTLHAVTPPPKPPDPHSSSPPRPSTIAAALFEEYQTPSVSGESIPEALARRSLKKRAKPWYEEVFDEDFLRTLPFMTPEQTTREVNFIRDALSPPKGGEVLDVGCGYGRHALELAQQGLRLTGLDLSLPMLIRAADSAQRRGLAVNFVHADMREMTFNGQFDAAYCVLSSFGYFDEETNLRVATAICRALKPGGRFLVDIINRDYIVGDLPSRVWWEGDGCVVLEEVDFNYHTSRVLIRRSVVFGNGRQSEQEISLRAYSLHEVGKVLRQAGLRVLDVSGALATKSRFFGAASRNIIAVCERPAS